jgi:hypothetical protein
LDFTIHIKNVNRSFVLTDDEAEIKPYLDSVLASHFQLVAFLNPPWFAFHPFPLPT